MTEAEKYFHELTGQIPDVEPGKMFGALCFKTPNGKAAAMFWHDFLVVKLSGKARDEALSLDGTRFFDPMDGRPMKEWIQIPFAYQHQWKEFALSAAVYVRQIPVKAASKKK